MKERPNGQTEITGADGDRKRPPVSSDVDRGRYVSCPHEARSPFFDAEPCRCDTPIAIDWIEFRAGQDLIESFGGVGWLPDMM